MGFLDDLLSGSKSEKDDWRKRDYELCGKCGHKKMDHNVMCSHCNCFPFIPTGTYAGY